MITAKIDRKQVETLLQFGFPLVFSGIAYWGLSATSSIALRSLSTFSELGIYTITTSIAGVAAIFQSIFSIIWAPTVYKWVAKGVDLSRIDHVSRQALALVCAIFIACGMFSWLADYILPPEYAMAKYLVLCAMVQPLLYTLSEITCIGIGITRRNILTIWVTVAALCTNALLSLWLVPLQGAAGAVVANAIAFLVFFIARTEISAFVWRKFARLRLYVLTCLAVACAVTTVTLGPSLPFHYSLAWMAFSPAAAWCFRMELKELVVAIRSAWDKKNKIQSNL